MNLIILGPPGAGKGTQAQEIVGRYDIPHISTGDILREHIANGTELGKKAKGYMDQGTLVPDSLVVSLIQERITRDDTKEGFLLDGFPRNVAQAVSLDAELDKLGIKLTKVININVDPSVLIDRATSRRVCPVCGATYNINAKPPKVEGKCDNEGADLIIRSDDTEETVSVRIQVYTDQTSPLIDYYKAQGTLFDVDGSQSIDEVTKDIFEGIES
ncbi:MAG: adenylate kinase [Tissierellia bacterium]|nr:adenylate kinase [Tissierellia bacterium]